MTEHFEIIKDVIFFIGIGCGVPIWIITVIKKGQKEGLQEFANKVHLLRKEYKKDRKQFSKQVKKKVSKDECSRLRSECECNKKKGVLR